MLAVPVNIWFFHGRTDRCLFLCAHQPDDLVALIQGQMCIAPHCTLIAGEGNCDGLDSKDEMERSDHNIVFDQFCTKFSDCDLGVNKDCSCQQSFFVFPPFMQIIGSCVIMNKIWALYKIIFNKFEQSSTSP